MSPDRLLAVLSRAAMRQAVLPGRAGLRGRRALDLLDASRIEAASDRVIAATQLRLLRAMRLLLVQMTGYRRAHRARLNGEPKGSRKRGYERTAKVVAAAPSRQAAANALQIHRSTLWRRLRRVRAHSDVAPVQRATSVAVGSGPTPKPSPRGRRKQ